jgi:hypothetical protein
MPWLFRDAVAGRAIIIVRHNGCSAAGERKHPRDHGMAGFMDGCVVRVVLDLRLHRHPPPPISTDDDAVPRARWSDVFKTRLEARYILFILFAQRACTNIRNDAAMKTFR